MMMASGSVVDGSSLALTRMFLVFWVSCMVKKIGFLVSLLRML